MEAAHALLGEMDGETVRFIMSLQLEDAEALSAHQSGNQRRGNLSDFELALAYYRSDLEASIAIISDRGVVQGIDANRIYGTDYNHHHAQEAFWTADLPPPSPAQQPPTQTCDICADARPIQDVTAAPCGHTYCRACLQAHFRTTLGDATLFPPRCCQQPIPGSPNRALLGAALHDAFQARRREAHTPNPIYCHRPACARLVPPPPPPPPHPHFATARCAACGAWTCVGCRRAAHAGECGPDPGMRLTLAAAKAEGWCRCGGCGHVIELGSGCNHISKYTHVRDQPFFFFFFFPRSKLADLSNNIACLCGAEFCYLCGEPWKTCPCAVFTEEQLLRQAPAPAADEAVQEVRECDLHDWVHFTGSYPCGRCHERTRRSIMGCRRCRRLACRPCAFYPGD